MKTLKILDWPEKRFYSETHPFHRWKNEFLENGLKIKYCHDHRKLRNADFLMIHSRYFDRGMNIGKGLRQEQLVYFFEEIKKTTGKLIWFDAADSSGSADFSLIQFVDVFLKKQILKDKSYYTSQHSNNDLRIWLNKPQSEKPNHPFNPCPSDQLHKLKLGWNLGLNDYRYFGYKLSRLSNFLSYRLYPPKFSNVTDPRTLDLTFRGTIHKDGKGSVKVSEQRNTVLRMLGELNLNIASGSSIPKARYWKELRNCKLSISPYGWGEICYRDFESFISGALLIKPSMQHLETYPDVFIPDETYIPVSWDLNDLRDKLDHILTNYTEYQEIAQNGQELYKKSVSDSGAFIKIILKAVS